MINITLSDNDRKPLYQQIIEQVKQNVVSDELKPGDHLPTVRELAEKLQINFRTAARAYRELKKKGIVGSNTRRGTIILDQCENHQKHYSHHCRLAVMINNSLIESLRQGYTPEELEEVFILQLAHWKF